MLRRTHNNLQSQILASSSSSRGLFRSTRPLLIAFHPDALKNQMKKNRSGFGDIDPERMQQFDDMQMGMSKEYIEKQKKERQEFIALPREEQVRRFMISQRKFDVDLVRKNDMNIGDEFALFKKTLAANDRKANRGFWIPFILSSLMIWGGSSYWVFWWY